MRQTRAIALSVGVLVWCWTFTSFAYLEPRVLTWVTFLTWASFYAAGGGAGGLTKSIAGGIVGALASATVMWIDSQLSVGAYYLLVLSILLGLLGWLLCTVASIPLLSCIPANFIGAASYFGAGAPMDVKLVWVLLSLIAGALLGLASQKLSEALTRTAVTGASTRATPASQETSRGKAL